MQPIIHSGRLKSEPDCSIHTPVFFFLLDVRFVLTVASTVSAKLVTERTLNPIVPFPTPVFFFFHRITYGLYGRLELRLYVAGV